MTLSPTGISSISTIGINTMHSNNELRSLPERIYMRRKLMRDVVKANTINSFGQGKNLRENSTCVHINRFIINTRVYGFYAQFMRSYRFTAQITELSI